MRLRLPQRRAHRIDLEGLSTPERALARFNASPAAATVAGLVRTLGQPRVSVGAAAGRRNEVRVTVAWELTWYQWAVDAGPGPGSVREIASGREVAELEGAARHWNATVLEGRLVMG